MVIGEAQKQYLNSQLYRANITAGGNAGEFGDV